MAYIFLIASIFLGDEWLKEYIEANRELGKSEDILGGRITVIKHHNKGAVLNFMEKNPEWVIRASFGAMGLLAAVMIQIFTSRGKHLLKLGTAMMAGGGLSNLFDRIKRGYVVDYFTINTGRLKQVIFNISDFMIFTGGLLLAVGSLFSSKKS